MFYTFRQNNSGGKFVENNDLAVNTVIEANSLKEAINKAEEIGIYFDGCDDGIDCPCCGDRWYRPWDDDGKEVPSIYDTPIDDEHTGYVIHYRNGTKKVGPKYDWGKSTRRAMEEFKTAVDKEQ